ncbi:MAG: hypothetical protein K2G11_05960, partial [Muribaculaceae bacterium]|nr:hypothetical protein [Muribaculaceae bacterium]
QNPNGKIIVPYKNPTPGMLPIVGSGNLTGFSYLTEDFLKLQKDLGINIAQAAMSATGGKQVFCDVGGSTKYGDDCAVFNYDDSTANAWGGFPNQRFSLYNAKNAGMKVFIRLEPESITSLSEVNPEGSVWTSNIEIYNKLFEYTKIDIRNQPALAGFWLIDEPTLSAFWGLREVRYTILRNELRSSTSDTSDPLKIPVSGSSQTISTNKVTDYPILSNLFPYLEGGTNGKFSSSQKKQLNGILNDYASNKVLGWGPVNTYKEYFESYASNLEPGLVCFDAYPFYIKSGEKMKLSPDFFRSLSFMMDQRKKNNITFWSTIQGMRVRLQSKVNGQVIVGEEKPAPSEGRLRFAVFCSLAFGAQGLVYWRITPGHDVETSDGFKPQVFDQAAISREGKKTKIGDLIKSVNEEVRRYQSIFLTEEEDLISCDIDACVSQWPETDGNTSANSKDYYKNVPLRVFKNDGIHTFGLLKRVNEGANLAFGIITKKYKGTLQSFKEYLIVVNLDSEKEQEIKLAFTSKVKDEMASPTPPPLITPGSNEYSHAYNTERVNDYSNRENIDDKDERVGTILEETLSSFTGVLKPGDWRIFRASSYIINT